MPRTADVIELFVPHPPADRPAARDRPRRPWPGYALVVCGVALVPWLVVLATGLPSTATAPHWTVAWVGLDAMEAAGLIATGFLTLRGSARRAPVAAATATLLVCDAWFDTTTSSGAGFGTAVLMAVAAELPLAVVCAVLALRAARGPLAADHDGHGRQDRADRENRRGGRDRDGGDGRPLAGVTVLPSPRIPPRNAGRAGSAASAPSAASVPPPPSVPSVPSIPSIPSVPSPYRPSPRGV
ncbi:hypothetical protein [Streptomyces sp. HPF1205]|uniref:hypothetical protein n=1 Tax=Streptomyces sp. HPF1205 TaxID=2873262 RepID=UPI001CECB4FC|nr:hypothetical protein [Streptomyces sp. HPF1205]